jgi:hypothetical protein
MIQTGIASTTSAGYNGSGHAASLWHLQVLNPVKPAGAAAISQSCLVDTHATGL